MTFDLVAKTHLEMLISLSQYHGLNPSSIPKPASRQRARLEAVRYDSLTTFLRPTYTLADSKCPPCEAQIQFQSGSALTVAGMWGRNERRGTHAE